MAATVCGNGRGTWGLGTPLTRPRTGRRLQRVLAGSKNTSSQRSSHIRRPAQVFQANRPAEGRDVIGSDCSAVRELQRELCERELFAAADDVVSPLMETLETVCLVIVTVSMTAAIAAAAAGWIVMVLRMIFGD